LALTIVWFLGPTKPKIKKSSAEQPSEDDFKPNRTLKAKVEEDEDIEEKGK